MGINVQVCWEKFANYWDVEMRLVPMEGDRFHLSARGGRRALRREHDRRRRDPRLDVRRLVRAGRGDLRGPRRPPGANRARHPGARRRRLGRVRRAVPRPRARLGLPPAAGRLDQHLRPQVRPRLPRASAGSSGATRTRCPRTSSSRSTTSAATCRPSRSTSRGPGAQVVAQYYNFLRLGFDGYREGAGATRATSPRASSARIAELGPFELLTRGDELPVFAFTLRRRRRELQRLRRLDGAARARLARPGLHVPGEPHRPRRAPRRRQAGLLARPGGHAPRGPRAAATASAAAAGASTRHGFCRRVPSLEGRCRCRHDFMRTG